jgi:hypothetical protein
LLEEGALTDRPYREAALRARKPQPRGLAARHHQGGHTSGSEGLFAELRSPIAGLGIAPTSGNSLHRNGLELDWALLAAVPVGVCGMSAFEGPEIDLSSLIQQPLASRVIQALPEAEDVILTPIAEAIPHRVVAPVVAGPILQADLAPP